MMKRISRPVFLNLLHIAMPVGAWTSILHRVSGFCLVLGLPGGIYLLDLSLGGPRGFEQAAAFVRPAGVRVVGVLFVWALAHHLLAGIRHLLSDVDIGSRLAVARRSAWVVNIAAAASAALCAALWL